MDVLCQTLGALASVQYVNYRVALKLRAIQTALLLDHVPCSQVPESLLQSDQGADPLAAVSAAKLEGILAQLYDSWHPGPGGGDRKQAKATCMNFILMTFCCLSGGELTVRMVQVFVALLCAANPLEKTKCLLLLSGYRDHLSKGEFTCFLGILSQIFSGFQEVFSVDTSEQLWALAVPHRNARESSVGLDEFAHLLTVSRHFRWLSTWQKLVTSEHSVHQLGCGSCLCKPMVGLRYQCVQCPRLHLCQMCHLTGTAATRIGCHRMDHQVQEYQLPPSPQPSWHRVLLCRAPSSEGGQLMQDEVLPCSPRAGGATPRLSLESIGPGPVLTSSPSQGLRRSAAHPSLTPPLCATEDECVAKQQWLRELVQRKKDMEQELQMVGQLREERAEVRRLQTQVEELFTTRQALSHELGDLLGKAQCMHREQVPGEAPDTLGLPSQWFGSETGRHTTLRRIQSAPRVAGAAGALRSHRVLKETLV